MFAVLNIQTGYLYSESPALKNQAKRAGMRWNNTSVTLAFARRYTRHKDALRQSQKLSDRTSCICAVVGLLERIVL